MSQDKQNNIKKEIKCSAKMEIIYRITNEDGTIEERVANVNVPGKGDMDFIPSSIVTEDNDWQEKNNSLLILLIVLGITTDSRFLQ